MIIIIICLYFMSQDTETKTQNTWMRLHTAERNQIFQKHSVTDPLSCRPSSHLVHVRLDYVQH